MCSICSRNQHSRTGGEITKDTSPLPRTKKINLSVAQTGLTLSLFGWAHRSLLGFKCEVGRGERTWEERGESQYCGTSNIKNSVEIADHSQHFLPTVCFRGVALGLALPGGGVGPSERKWQGRMTMKIL